ncbi:MAG: hypothetical protein ABMA01_14220 [Chthoniobacteraceae bacterium]
MKPFLTILTLALVCPAGMSHAEESKPAALRTLKDRTARGTLADRREMVRGDTGKWNDRATLQHMPPIQGKPQGLSLDNWAEQMTGKNPAPTPADDNWLVFRTRQLDDNDRVWLERIERRGNEFTVVLSEAIWQGRYNKTFTCYEVVAVNLGKLPPGEYSVKWIVTPLVFERFEDPGQPKDNWPKDERPGKARPVELKTAFAVREK